MESAYCIAVHSPTHTAEARRTALQVARDLAFDETEMGNVALVATEAAKNVLKHGGGGNVLIRAAEFNGSAAVEMLAIDKGPGIADIGRCFEDGYSTTGTPGTGLGAISRLSSFHDIYSRPSQGTALLVLIGKRNAHRAPRTPAGGFRVGAVAVPKAGQPVSGDAWNFLERPGNGGRLIVADGLGHGLLAADAAGAAIRVGEQNVEDSGVTLMKRIHERLRPTRGAAVAVAEIDPGHRLVRYTGVGNINGAVVSAAGVVRRMVSHAGTAGHEVHKIAEFTYPWDRGDAVIMHSDGLHSQWSLDRYPGLVQRHPGLMAAILYRDFLRGQDDATVVVASDARENE